MNLEGRNVNVDSVLKALGLEIQGQSGSERLLNCLWHDDTGRNLSVNVENGMYHCWVCSGENPKSKGSIISLVMRLRGMNKTEAMEFLVERSSVLTAEQLMKEVKAAFRKHRTKKPERISIARYLNPHHNYWRHERGIKWWTAEKFKLGYDDKRNHAIIPITVDKVPIAIIRRTMHDVGIRYVYSKGFDRNDVLFGLDRCKGNGLYIVEGPVDALKVHQAGYNGVAVLGDYLSPNQIKLIRQYSPEYIVIMTDEDLGGQLLANQIGKVLSDMPLFYTRFPHGKNDPGACTTMEIWEAINNKKSVASAWLRQAMLHTRPSSA